MFETTELSYDGYSLNGNALETDILIFLWSQKFLCLGENDFYE